MLAYALRQAPAEAAGRMYGCAPVAVGVEAGVLRLAADCGWVEEQLQGQTGMRQGIRTDAGSCCHETSELMLCSCTQGRAR